MTTTDLMNATAVNHSFIASKDEFKSIDTSFSVKAVAQVTYIDVLIQDVNNPLHALVDSSKEICVAHKRLFNVQVLWKDMSEWHCWQFSGS